MLKKCRLEQRHKLTGHDKLTKITTTSINMKGHTFMYINDFSLNGVTLCSISKNSKNSKLLSSALVNSKVLPEKKRNSFFFVFRKGYLHYD